MQPQFNFFAEQVGCTQGSVAAIMSCLRQAKVSDIVHAENTPLYVG